MFSFDHDFIFMMHLDLFSVANSIFAIDILALVWFVKSYIISNFEEFTYISAYVWVKDCLVIGIDFWALLGSKQEFGSLFNI